MDHYTSHPPNSSAVGYAPHATSITTLTFGGALDAKLKAIAAAGFIGVNVFEDDIRRFSGSRDEVRELCQQLGLRIIAYPFEGSSIPERRIRSQCGKMQELGCGIMVIPGDAVTEFDDLVAAVRTASEFGVKIALDAVPWARWINSWEVALEAVKRIDHPSLGLCLDSLNILAAKHDLAAISRIPGQHIFHVQIADGPILNLDARTYSRHHRNFPAQGALDVIGFLQAIRETGYRGALSLEVFNDEVRSAPEERSAREAMQSLLLYMDQEYGNILPPLPEVVCIEAIEFSVVEHCLPRLERFLRDLGLRKVARHVQTDVTVFSAGNVHMLLNSEPESPASSLMALHDLSVLAIAVRVASVPLATARAAALGCTIVPASAQEPGMVKVHSPDGKSYVYLVDQQQAWKSMYRYEPDDEPGDAYQFLGIDHLAHALDRISMDRLVLFCKALFGMEDQGTFELQDAFGMTKSRNLVTPNGNLRFPLNMSDDRATSVGRLVRDSGGSIVHHVALQTADIFSTVVKLRQSATRHRFLRIPQHYYEDIAMRYQLQPEFVARMREYDIMYDRDEMGEFLHLSTEQFDGGLFVEVVQRNGGYLGFGVANAPVRMGLHLERRNLILRSPSGREHDQSSPKRSPGKGKGMIVVFPTGSEEIVQLVGKILGLQCVIHGPGGLPLDCVIGVPVANAAAVLPSIDAAAFIVLNLHPLSNDLDLPAYSAVSSFCAYEYLFPPPPRPFPTRDFTRFLSFITGQSSPADSILAKPRSTFISLTFPDLHTALPNLDIITIGADAIEFRIDYLNPGPSTSAQNPLPPLSYIASQLFLLRSRSELPIIFTLRSPPEGGRCPAFADHSITHSILQKGLQWGCEFLDVEIHLPSSIHTSLSHHAFPTKIIASYHDLVGTLSWSNHDQPTRLYHTGRSYGDITKVVGFATSIQDNFALEQFRAKITASYPDHPFLAFNANAPGQLSRILNTFFTPITHPLLPNPAAPGQLSAAEINKARTIMGLEQPKTIFTIGLPDLSFWPKCINELGLPHSYQPLTTTLSPTQLAALVRRLDFGGSLLGAPIPANAPFLSNLTPTAREVGHADAIITHGDGVSSVERVGDNITATSLCHCLLARRAPWGWRRFTGLVVASDAADGAAGVWALKKVGVEVVWTVGFRYNGCRGWKKDEEGAGRVGVIVSVLREEERGLVKPLVGMVKEARERVEGDEEELVVVEHRGEEGWRRFVEFGIEGLVGMRVRGEVVWVGSGGGGGAGF